MWISVAFTHLVERDPNLAPVCESPSDSGNPLEILGVSLPAFLIKHCVNWGSSVTFDAIH